MSKNVASDWGLVITKPESSTIDFGHHLIRHKDRDSELISEFLQGLEVPPKRNLSHRQFSSSVVLSSEVVHYTVHDYEVS